VSSFYTKSTGGWVTVREHFRSAPHRGQKRGRRRKSGRRRKRRGAISYL